MRKNEAIRRLLPGWTGEDIRATVEESWVFVDGIPFPGFDIQCPVCSYGELQAKHWLFCKRSNHDGEHRKNYRCEIPLKCGRCGWDGIISPAFDYDQIPEIRMYTIEEVREIASGL